MNDTRNVTDEFKGWSEDDIRRELDERGVELEIAVENIERDFNMGSIIRTANAFGVRHVHVVGRRQWNKRGAMATDKYLHMHYHATIDDFARAMALSERSIIAVDNVDNSQDLRTAPITKRCVLVFGSEGAGLSVEMISKANISVEVRQKGSTRSLNVGAAAAIVMYEWARRFDS